MSDNKITEKELTEIRSFAEAESQAFSNLGYMDYQISTFEKQKKELQENIYQIQSMKTDKLEKLQTKYGGGSINIDTGEFTSTK